MSKVALNDPIWNNQLYASINPSGAPVFINGQEVKDFIVYSDYDNVPSYMPTTAIEFTKSRIDHWASGRITQTYIVPNITVGQSVTVTFLYRIHRIINATATVIGGSVNTYISTLNRHNCIISTSGTGSPFGNTLVVVIDGYPIAV